jgi:HAD superfamily hydrolase (TIGR01490 family)
LSITAAFFDVDGTLIKGNAIDHYLYLSTKNISLIDRWKLYLRVVIQIPYYMLLDRISRTKFNEVFYRNYCDKSVAHLQDLSQKYFAEKLCDRLFPAAKDCIIQHKKNGKCIVLVSGSLDVIISPLAKFLCADVILTVSLKINNGCYTGEIIGDSITDEGKARAIQNLAEQLDIDLSKSYAYGDSISDLPMLKSVGHPVAVNPDRTLNKIAKQNGFSIKYWSLIQ